MRSNLKILTVLGICLSVLECTSAGEEEISQAESDRRKGIIIINPSGSGKDPVFPPIPVDPTEKPVFPPPTSKPPPGISGESLCKKDPFIASKVTLDGKVFLAPWDPKLRKGDWLYNLGFCHNHCAEMVSLHNADEDVQFHNFVRDVGIVSPGVWLGAKIYNKEKTVYWGNNTRAADYTNWYASEPDGNGNPSCLMTEWVNKNNQWWDHYCTVELSIACQRFILPGEYPGIQSQNFNRALF